MLNIFEIKNTSNDNISALNAISRVFLDIEVDDEYIGKVVLHLRYDVAPR